MDAENKKKNKKEGKFRFTKVEIARFQLQIADFSLSKKRPYRRCRGSNPGHPRDRREYSPLYYNDFVVGGGSTTYIILKIVALMPKL